RRRRQEAARGEARAHPHPPPRHGDLAEDEAVAALDEAHDAFAHGAQRDESGDTDRDTRDRERVAVEDSAETYHSKRDSTGRPARRRIQTFTRAIENRSRSDARARHDMPRKAPPDNTLSTASPTARNRSPTTGVLRYEKFASLWTSVTCWAPRRPSATRRHRRIISR